MAALFHLHKLALPSRRHNHGVMHRTHVTRKHRVLFFVAMLSFALNITFEATVKIVSSSSLIFSIDSPAVSYSILLLILQLQCHRSTISTSKAPRSNNAFPLLLIALSLEFVSPLEDLYDLDHDDDLNDIDDHYMNDGISEENEEQLEGKKKKYTPKHSPAYGKTPQPNLMERFTRVVASEILRRVPSIQIPFQLQPPWKGMNLLKGKEQRNEGKSDSLSKDKGTSQQRKDVQTKSIDIQQERRALTCPPELNEDETAEVQVDFGDKSVALCSSNDESSESCKVTGDNDDKIKDVDDVQPGMVVYVFPQGKLDKPGPSYTSDSTLLDGTKSLEIREQNSHEDNDAERDDGSIRGTRCIFEMGQQYDSDEQVVQYTLLDKEPVELGNIDVHRVDFAYQPVVLTLDGVGSGGSAHPARYVGHELETRIKPEDERIEKMSSLPSPQQSSFNDDGDHQVSFRWWSWVSQFKHRGESYSGDDNEGSMNPDIIVSDSSEHHSYQYHGQQSSYQSNIYEEDGQRPFAGGSHGEIWRCRRRCRPNNINYDAVGASVHNQTSYCDDDKDLIVKRLKIEYGFPVLEAGLREVYFGELLAREVESSMLFTTYVDHFFRETKRDQVELWIVFENAGPSLRSFLYSRVDTGGFMLFQHSAFWRRLRRGISGRRCKGCEEDEALVAAKPITYPDRHQKPDHKQKSQHETKSKARYPEGRALLREVLRQLITAVAFLHERGIVHRDIKPSNIMCRTAPPTNDGIIPRKIESVRCLLGDFSSAWDNFSSRNLYTNGPSSKEQTDEYAPPEVLFQGSTWSPFYHDNPFSYDSWSIGVVALEMLLGTPNVFSVDQRTTALLTNRLKKEGASSHDIQRALYLAALSQFCIYVPTDSEGKWPLRRGDPLHNVKPVKNKCSMDDFHGALRARDPLGIGFDEDSNTLLHLVYWLLRWNPMDRLSAADALQHPYFASEGQNAWNPTFLQTRQFGDRSIVVPGGEHTALESQTLDPRVDILTDTTTISEFVCPKCNKTFTDYNSCQRHARSRRHALFCTYDRSSLPQSMSCLNAHSMLPTHPTSGYCDIQGRRPTIEDFHTVHLTSQHQFYGVFDGHLGNLASKYAASSFYTKIEACLAYVDDNIKSSQLNWKELASSELVQSFEELHDGIIGAVTSSPGGVMDESGTTATILYVTQLALVVANVGDSRAIMSQWSIDKNSKKHVAAVQLTIDHVASSEKEQKQILSRGGYVSESGGIVRVNGSLAVSRSLGDIKLAQFLSRTPHVFAVTKEEAHKICQDQDTKTTDGQILPCFIILASDGLWDVMSNQEAVELAFQVISGNGNESGTAYQEAAEVLTQEAYVRGSSDNIGVCVVAIT